MNRKLLEDQILSQHKNINKTNLKFLSKIHLEQWLEKGEVHLDVQTLISIFEERNLKAINNIKLSNENFSLNSKIKSMNRKIIDSIKNNMLDLSKSEIIKIYNKLFGRAKSEDDDILEEIGAVSKESALRDIQKSKEIASESRRIAEIYQQKYGKEKILNEKIKQ